MLKTEGNDIRAICFLMVMQSVVDFVADKISKRGGSWYGVEISNIWEIMRK